MNSIVQKIRAVAVNDIPSQLNVVNYTAFRSILLGAGLCYAIAEGKYHHVPLAIVVPSAYSGYQMYKHKDAVAEWTRAKLLS
jgi:hypothetical protein